MIEYYVEVVELETKEVVRRIGPNAASLVDKVEWGVNINLDRDRFYTRQVKAEKGRS